MFESTLNSIIGFFDKRFITTIFLPCLVIISIFFSLIIYTQGVETAIEVWSSQHTEVQAFIVIIYISFVYFIAYLLLINLKGITRIYEGYWDNIIGLSLLYKLGKSYQQEKFNAMKKYVSPESSTRNTSKGEAYFNKLYFYYPFKKEDVMPTMLGNVLRSSERYTEERYGVDAVLIFPRLYQLLPDSSKKAIADYKSGLDSMLIISLLSIFFAILSGLYLAFIGASYLLLLIAFGGSLLVSWLAYRGAIVAAVGYSESIKSAFDLYRKKMFEALGYLPPTSLKEEKEFWLKIGQFIFYNEPCDLPYSNPDK